jgi:hypothetical protein
VAGVLSALLCCSSEHAVNIQPTNNLAPNIAFRIGNVEVSVDYLASVQSAQSLSLEAAQMAVADDVYAALRVAQVAPQIPNYARRAVLARTLLDAIRREAEQVGDPSEQELEVAAERYWRDVARPSMYRVIHAVVEVKQRCDSAAARRVAEEIARKLPSRTMEAEFRSLVSETPSGDCPPKIEELEPVAADGRTLGETRYVPEFVRATHALKAVGEHSPAVQTEFGFHVILLTEIQPERVMQDEERREWLTPDILKGRAKERLQAVLNQNRQATNPALNNDAVAAMGLLLSSKPAEFESN